MTIKVVLITVAVGFIAVLLLLVGSVVVYLTRKAPTRAQQTSPPPVVAQPVQSEEEVNNAEIRTVMSDRSMRVVVRTDGAMLDNHGWRHYLPSTEGRFPREYWVMPSAAATVHWVPVNPGPRDQPRANLQGKYYLIRGYGIGDENRLGELLMAQRRTQTIGFSAGVPTVFIDDDARGVHFVGEAGTLVPDARYSIWLIKVIAKAPCSRGATGLCSPVK